MADFQSKWKGISFVAGEVYVIHRKDFDSPFEIYYRVPFGGAEAEKLKESEPPKPKAKTGLKVFLGNLSFSATESDIEKAFLSAGLKTVSVSLAINPGGRPKVI
jgi:RNA recognition motif-containing protein